MRPTLRQVKAEGFLEAAAMLEREAVLVGTGGFQLCVSSMNYLEMDRTEYAVQVRRFVTALRNNHQIERLYLEDTYSSVLDNVSKIMDDDTDHLIGQVLGSHRSLTSIILNNGFLGRRKFIQSFVSSAVLAIANPHHPPLRGELGISGICCPNFSNGEGVRCLAQLLQQNIPLEKLDLWCWSVSDGSRCNLIFEALDGNTQLRELELADLLHDVVSVSAVQALGRSNVRELTCSGELLGFYEDTGNELRFAEGLRTNESLESLYCHEHDSGTDIFDYEYQADKALRYVELLTTFNFTLQRLQLPRDWFDEGPIQSQIDQVLESNRGVRHAHRNLQTISYHASQSFTWPSILERISSKPSLIYRFIRHGNLVAVIDHLVRIFSTSSGITIRNHDDDDDALQHHHIWEHQPPLKVRRTKDS